MAKLKALRSALWRPSPTPDPSPRGGGEQVASVHQLPPPSGGRAGVGARLGTAIAGALTRRSALHLSLRPGRHGADRPGGPGVQLAMRHPVSIVTVIARQGKAQELSGALSKQFGLACPPAGHSIFNDRLALHWCGFEQWYAVADGYADGWLYETLRETCDGLASVSDQSHGRVIIRIEGPCARAVLAKGTGIDLHPRAFGPGRSAVTQMAHIGVHIAEIGPDAFELSLFRGFTESFWEWLGEMSEEFGYEVR
jgi:heterotetrameric sarcosine oxidase gamma subunit